MSRVKVLSKQPLIKLMLSASIAVVLSRLLIVFMCIIIETGAGIFNELNKWDSGWYVSVIQEGYFSEPREHPAGDAANWAFFPLMPMVVDAANKLLPGDIYPSAFIVNTLLFWFTLVLAGDYIYQEKKHIEHAMFFQWLYAFCPQNYLFSILYTESLYVFLVSAFFYFMRKKKYIIMGLMGALCGATRNTGVFLIFAIAVFYTECYLSESVQKNPFNWLTTALAQPSLVLGVFLIPLGLFSYMLFLNYHVGDGLAFLHIQRAWGGHMQNPLNTMISGITAIGTVDFYYSIFAFLWILSIWKLLKHKKWPEMSVSIIYLLIPLAIRMQSMPRYMIGSFLPLYGLVCDYRHWSKAQKITIFTLSFLWGVFCLKRWIIGDSWLV